MTMRYAHMVTEHLHRAVAKIGTNPGTTGTVSANAPTANVPSGHLKRRKSLIFSKGFGGEGGIRTHGAREGTTVFETGADGPAQEEADKDTTESDG
jgi:hypothetical protein